MRKNDIRLKKIKNVILLGMVVAILLGIYINIIRSRAETDTTGKLVLEADAATYGGKNFLRITSAETVETSTFLGISGLQRKYVESITFLDSTSGASGYTTYDVSARVDNSIIAWYEDSDSDGTKEVYIASDGTIYAHPDSSWLFANIGKSSSCNDTQVLYNLNLLNTSYTTNMARMFDYFGYTALTSFDVSSLDTSNVTNMERMFSHCGEKSMTTLTLGDNFTAASATNLKMMFYWCGYYSMTTFDFGDNSNFKVGYNVNGAIDMTYMFFWCGYKSMTTLDLGSNFYPLPATGNTHTTSMRYMFSYCGHEGMTELNFGDNFNTTYVTDMSFMFYQCGSYTLESLSLGDNFNTQNVTTMKGMFMFFATAKLNGAQIDLGNNFNTENVTDMSFMFYAIGMSSTNMNNNYLNAILTNENFDTSSVTTMRYMFGRGDGGTLNLSGFDTSNVTDMSGMFYRALISGITVGDNFKVNNVTDMSHMFLGTLHLKTITYNGTQSTFNLLDMFDRNGDGVTDTSNVTNMSYMFGEWYSTSNTLSYLDLTVLDTTNVTNMSNMFVGSSMFTEIVPSASAREGTGKYIIIGGNFTVKNVTDMSYMFAGRLGPTDEYNIWVDDDYVGSEIIIEDTETNWEAITTSTFTNIDLSAFDDTSKVTNMEGMFYHCESLSTLDVSVLDTSAVTNMSKMFEACTGFTTAAAGTSSGLILGGDFVTTNVENMSYMFSTCCNLTSIDLSQLSTSNVTNMEGMFYCCESLTQGNLDISKLDTSKVTSMGYMFAGCTGLTSLDVSVFNTQNVQHMFGLFKDCTGLTNITFGNTFVTDNVISMEGMFQNCSSLTSLDLSSFNTANVEFMGTYFDGSEYRVLHETAVVGNGDYQTTDGITYEDAGMFSGCTALEEIIISENFTTANVKTMGHMFNNCSSLTKFGPADSTGMDFSTFNTENVINMEYMFNGCTSFTELDISSFYMKNIVNMRYMFYYCTGLTTLDLGPGFVIANIYAGDFAPNLCFVSNIGTKTDSGCTIYVPEKIYDDSHQYKTVHVSEDGTSTMGSDYYGFIGTDFSDVYPEITLVLKYKTEWNFVEYNYTNGNKTMEIIVEGSVADNIDLDGDGIYDLENIYSGKNFNKTVTSNLQAENVIIKLTENGITVKNPENISIAVETLTTTTGETVQYKITLNCEEEMHTKDITIAIDGNIPLSEGRYKGILQDSYTYTSYGPETSQQDTFGNANVVSEELSTEHNYLKTTNTETEGTSTFLGITEEGVTREYIEKVEFCNYITTEEITTYDVSQAQDGSILAWCKDEDGDGYYEVYIGSEDITIMANPDSSYLFAHLGSNNDNNINPANQLIYNIELLNTSEATDMSYMFYSCAHYVTDFDLGENFDTQNVEDMNHMFSGCALYAETFDLGENFNTENVKDMTGMFMACGAWSLKSLDLGDKFNTQSVENMSLMFAQMRKG